MENIIIRNVRKEDINQVAEIRVEGWKKAYQGIIDYEYLEKMNINENIKIFTERYYNNKEKFIVAEIDSKVVGFTRYIDNNTLSPETKEVDCELLALYVLLEMKRKGIGKKLFEYVKKEFINLNKKKMILWCLKENYDSRKFYEKVGGILGIERDILIANKKYKEVSYVYDLK